MSLQDPIANFLTSIRNAQKARKKSIFSTYSKIKYEIAKILEKEGYIQNCDLKKKKFFCIKIVLKYFQKQPVIENIKRISKPGLRIYSKKKDIPKIMGGMGIVILSTSKGIMTDKKARKMNLGGEIICSIS
ncbi:30S ribosomal protein S8 [bacterium endosymbiont of Pedicinus badii]|uniref:30S ribosomal protein S8 n=1 Tax=bacterium endosymbiont of Pedicinus badii TaxID=1719126 RepID=UPI0009BAE913|nr:30S ribosomal protein S8 [bacterium endosymbiont of Pedicinus badii]OQM34112.1 30S ribosomal protein S8 [bacterium endosymbiont of Pedicinus badii]